jgi:hypothetical protein
VSDDQKSSAQYTAAPMQILDSNTSAQALVCHIEAELLNGLQICHHSKGMEKVHVLNGPTRANKGNH